jgi:choline dehydrogenase-like flavoprotein
MISVGIVGSGHTGITVAKVLVRRGIRPVILDVGETLDPDRQAVVARMSKQRKTEWSDEDLAVVTRNPTVSGSKVLRLAYGSGYPYAGTREIAPLDIEGDGPSPSMARGGYSTIWGGAMLPAAAADIRAWPIAHHELDDYYRLVLGDLPFSAATDKLARDFPLHRDRAEPLELSPAIRAFLKSLDDSRYFEGRDDVAYGQARLAVYAKAGLRAPGCVYCGRCLSGCVYGSIYSAEHDLERLIRAGAVDYRPGRTVLKVSEQGNKVEVLCHTDGGHERVVLDRMFLAAGALSSTRLVLESKLLYGRPTVMNTTQGFITPMLRFRGASFPWPSANTLAGAFFEFKLPSVSDNWIHAQISAPNELALAKLGYRANPKSPTDRIKKFALERLLVATCTFHSDQASSYVLELKAPAPGKRAVLSVRTMPSATFRTLMKKGARRFAQLLWKVGVVPLRPFGQGDPGKPIGWHFGGTMPMTKEPTDEMHTDVLGRPGNWKRIHVVDSSVFPSVPATTIALLAMANAARIADTTPLDN